MNKQEIAEYMQKRLGLFANPRPEGFTLGDFIGVDHCEKEITFFFHDKAPRFPLNEDEIAFTKGDWQRIKLFFRFLSFGGANPRINPECACQVIYSCNWKEFNWENAVRALAFEFNGLDEKRAEYAERGLDVEKKVAEWRKVIMAMVWDETNDDHFIPIETFEDLEMVVKKLSELTGVKPGKE